MTLDKNINALIIFIKNPILTKVKTRLAKDLGDEIALKIYLSCINITIEKLQKLKDIKIIFFFSEYIDENICKEKLAFVQEGNDLGEKMSNAFKKIFDLGYKNIVIIGSDLPELNSSIIQEAFYFLNDKNNFVIGPSLDGGYYLLGMNIFNKSLFQNIKWSTPEVLNTTINIIKKDLYSYKLLKEFRDLDDIEDFKYFLKLGYFSRI